jgi:MFS family permease
LFILFLLGIFNYLDRTLIAILQIPMKSELGLSDAQLGLVIGASFGIVYTLAGLPMGLLADRLGRRTILALALLLWTLLTGLTGFAAGLGLLLLCRMGVALGEAACAPITHSLISDYFPLEKRARATAFWALSLPVGIVFGFLLGGWLNEVVGWRRAFMLMGVTGLFLVPFIFMLPDSAPSRAGRGQERSPRIMPMIRMVWQCRTYRYVLIGAALHLYTLHATGIWMPPFFARVHHLTTFEVAGVMALLGGIGGGIGMLISGVAGERLARRDVRWYLFLSAGAIALMIPAKLLQLWSPSLGIAVAAGLMTGIMGQIFFAPAIAVTQSLMPSGVRSFTGAIYVCFANVFSMSLGPVIAGRISDDIGGPTGLPVALSVSLAGSLLSIPFFLAAARNLVGDLARVDERAATLGITSSAPAPA